MSSYVNVHLANANRSFDSPWTYKIPFGLENKIKVGAVVKVPFASRSKAQRAYVTEILSQIPEHLSESKVKEVISLPMHTELDDEQIKFITDSILEFFK